jgi:hypothetical protein
MQSVAVPWLNVQDVFIDDLCLSQLSRSMQRDAFFEQGLQLSCR